MSLTSNHKELLGRIILNDKNLSLRVKKKIARNLRRYRRYLRNNTVQRTNNRTATLKKRCSDLKHWARFQHPKYKHLSKCKQIEYFPSDNHVSNTSWKAIERWNEYVCEKRSNEFLYKRSGRVEVVREEEDEEEEYETVEEEEYETVEEEEEEEEYETVEEVEEDKEEDEVIIDEEEEEYETVEEDEEEDEEEERREEVIGYLREIFAHIQRLDGRIDGLSNRSV